MIIQGSDEWHQTRLGKVTASRVHGILKGVKGAYLASRASYMAELTAERLTGNPAEGFTNDAMQWGTDTEPQARAWYELEHGVTVEEVGFVDHPRLAMTGASPDGLVGDSGLVEIKCPKTHTHIETLKTGKFNPAYLTQIQWQLACTERDWCDFMSFDPRMPDHLQIYTTRIERDAERIAEIEEEVGKFLRELEDQIEALNRLGQKEAAE